LSPFKSDTAKSNDDGATPRLALLCAHACGAAIVAGLLAVVSRPIFTDDLWWHLALGRAYANAGPWLLEDPLLFTAPGPPAPAAWLSDLLLYDLHVVFGFTGLRIAHVLLVAAIAWLVWSTIQRTCRSAALASLCMGFVLAASTYRLVQLRPHLFTIIAALLLARWLFATPQEDARWRAPAAVALLASWANLHAGFVLGPAMLGVVAAAWLVHDAVRWGRVAPGALSPRTRGLLGVLAVATLATLLNPSGITPHLAYWMAGDETPSLARVGDEWSRITLFALPRTNDALHWFGAWGSLLATLAGWSVIVRRRNADARDVAFGALALLSAALILMAVRFSWLCVFPLAFLALVSRKPLDASPMRTAWICAAASIGLAAAFFQVGAWPTFSQGLTHGYQRPYMPARYNAHAVWWLADAGLTGPLFAEYSQSGFLGYWLAPGIKTFVNGSLNVTSKAIDANLPIRERRSGDPAKNYVDMLDEQGVELFLGIRLPQARPTTQPWFHTTAHLEGASEWVQVFRNLDSAVYLRDQKSNDDNFERVASYYRERDIPFDRARGFDPAAAIERSPDWSIERGLIPPYYDQLVVTANTAEGERGHLSKLALAELNAALGLYAEAIELDRETLRRRPRTLDAQRRLIWSLLRDHRFDAAAARARAFAAHKPADALSRDVIAVANAASQGRLEGEALEQRIATLPVFSVADAARTRRSIQPPEVRLP
jgi:hypothetical protein